jgi:hemolysin III
VSIRYRSDHNLLEFFRRTVSAQLHTVGLFLMFPAGAYLLPLAYHSGGWPHFLACLAFIVTGSLVFFASSLVHFAADGFDIDPSLHRFLENLDHYSIYLFIAGTYTPFVLSAISQVWQVPILIAIWTIAIVGILYTTFKRKLPPRLRSRAVDTGIFVLMGWTLVIRINEVLFEVPRDAFHFLVAGGLAYSIGAVVYVIKRPKLFAGFFGYHELWHVLVLIGAGFHYLMILSLYLP